MKKYTDEDVARLVDAAESMAGNATIREELSHSTINLERLLTPFISSKEEELTEELCIEFESVWNKPGSWDHESDDYKRSRMACMTAVLNLLRKKGHYKEA